MVAGILQDKFFYTEVKN